MPHAAGLYYETHGRDDTPPLILSSGLGGSASYWKPNIPALAEYFSVIAYDHRGTGRSDRVLPDAVTVDDFADDIIALIDALDIPKAHLIGHAAGGVAGLALALKAPERLDRLVVINGWALPDPHFRRCFEARLNLLRHVGVEAFLRAQPIFLYPANWSQEYSDQLDAEMPHQLAQFPGLEVTEKRIAALASFNIFDRLNEICVPMLAYSVGDDVLVPSINSMWMLDHIPGGRSAHQAWGGHACNVTDPESFNRIVLDFLRS